MGFGFDAIAKANLFYKIFASKAYLNEPVENRHSAINPPDALSMSGFFPIRVRQAKAILMKLKEDSSTGPDKLPGTILKRCAASLAWPVALLARIL